MTDPAHSYTSIKTRKDTHRTTSGWSPKNAYELRNPGQTILDWHRTLVKKRWALRGPGIFRPGLTCRNVLAEAPSAASSTSTTGLPDHTSLGILRSATAPLLPRTPSRAASRLYGSPRKAIPSTRNPPPLLHTSTETAPLRVFGPFRSETRHLDESQGPHKRSSGSAHAEAI
jgi:hypothetical protein